MGHLLFLLLHFAAIMFGVVGLFITIPTHIIYSAMKKNKTNAKDSFLTSFLTAYKGDK
jgi:predicted PurR-regulated permease PerM